MSYLKKYPLSILVLCVILFLSFFNPPETPLNKVSNIDKILHFTMYFGFCAVLWFEYFRSHVYPNTMSVWSVKLDANFRSHWLLDGRQFASVCTNHSCRLALIPIVTPSFLWLMYLAESGMKV